MISFETPQHTNGSGPAHDSEPPESTPADPWSSRVIVVETDWYTKAPPPRTWLLRDRRTSAGVLPLGKVGQVVGEGGVSKTTVFAQLARAVATGSTWLGSLDVATPGRVLAIFGEEDAEEIHRKSYNAAQTTSGVNPPRGSIVTLPLAGVPSEMVIRDPHGNPMDGPFLLWLRRFLASGGGEWRLILVDPLSRFAGLDAEKDNALATRFVEALESLAVQTRATVLVAHHSNQVSRGVGSKMTATSSRGVTALSDGVRWQMTMAAEEVAGLEGEAHERLGQLVTIAFSKSNYSKRGDPIVCRRDQEHGGALIPLDDTDAELVREARATDDPKSRRAAEREQRIETVAQSKAAREAAKLARVEAEDQAVVAILRERPGIGTVDLRAAMSARLAHMGGCGRDAVAVAVVRLGARVRIEPSVRNSHRHYLVEEQ